MLDCLACITVRFINTHLTRTFTAAPQLQLTAIACRSSHSRWHLLCTSFLDLPRLLGSEVDIDRWGLWHMIWNEANKET